MSQQSAAGADEPVFREIRTLAPEKVYRYRPLKILTYVLTGLIAFKCVSLLAQSAALGHQWLFLRQAASQSFASRDAMVSAARQSDGFVQIASISLLVGLNLAYIVACFWIYRAACNVRALGARGLQNSPGWAVGWYFVPVMWLFKPFGAMLEIWQSSAAPAQWRLQRTPPLFGFWWAAWLTVNIAGYVVYAASKIGRTIPNLILMTQIDMADGVLDFAASVLFLLVVLKIHRAQSAARSVNDPAEVFA